MLFLLLSQQASLSHVVSHWAPAAIASASGESVATGDTELSAHACGLCVAAAQYAAAIPASTFSLQAAEPPAIITSSAQVRPSAAAPTLAFHSRAPPA
jgi:tetrahydromethanopterin S-methyltransferase subunit D